MIYDNNQFLTTEGEGGRGGERGKPGSGGGRESERGGDQERGKKKDLCPLGPDRLHKSVIFFFIRSANIM